MPSKSLVTNFSLPRTPKLIFGRGPPSEDDLKTEWDPQNRRFEKYYYYYSKMFRISRSTSLQHKCALGPGSNQYNQHFKTFRVDLTVGAYKWNQIR